MIPFRMLDVTASSLYAKATIVFAGVTIFFHMLGLTTDNWCHLRSGDQRYVLGLWRGCMANTPRQWSCSDSLITAGFIDRNWGVGPQVLMVMAMVLLLLAEIVVLAYTCVGKLIMYRLRLAEITIGLSLAASIFTLTGLILFGSEINKYPDETNARIAWSFGMCVLSLLFSLATSGLVLLDRKVDSYSATSTPDSVSLDLYMDQDDGYRY